MIPPTHSRRLLRLAAILAVILGASTVEAETYRVGPGRTYKNLQAVTRILNPGDLVIAISGSGNSKNVVRAIEYANQSGADTLAVVGYDGGALKRLARHVVWVPSFDMQLCEEVHLMFGHMVMKALCGTYIED